MFTRGMGAAVVLASAWSVHTATGADLTGKVIGEEGAPLAGATVWLCARNIAESRLELLAETTTGPDGGFALGDTSDARRGDPSFRLLCAHLEGFAPCIALAPESPTPLEIRLPTATPASGRITNAAGGPISGAKVTVGYVRPWCWPTEAWGFLAVPEDITTRFATATDASGACEVDAAWLGAEVSVSISAPGYGTITAAPSVDLTAIRMASPGRLEGRVTGADDPSVFAGMGLVGSAESAGGEPTGRIEVAVRADGTFSADHVSPGTYYVRPKAQVSDGWHVRGRTRVKVRSGETSAMELPAERTVTVHGRVVRADTGQGLPHVYVGLFPFGPTYYLTNSASAYTDAAGEYEAACLPGQTYLEALSGAYLARGPQETSLPVGPDGGAVPDIVLEPAHSLTVLVIDEGGAPVPGATVDVRPNGELSDRLRAHGRVTGSDGTYRVGMLLSGPAVVQAGKEDVLSEEAQVEVGRDGIEEPCRLVLRPGVAATVTAKLADQDGRPVAGAEVVLFEERGTSVLPRPIPGPDVEGRVTQPGLAPGAAYRLSITAPHAFPVETEAWPAQAGMTHDFGAVELRVCRAAVGGVVVDEAGAPFAGARVFDAIDAPRPVEARTDAEGRFSLFGLMDGTVCVFAESPGRVLTCALGRTGDGNLRLALVPRGPGTIGEPVPSPIVAPPAEETKRRALAVLTRVFQEGEWPKWEGVRDTLLGFFARIDPQAAYQTAGQARVSTTGISLALGRQALAADPAEAIALLRQCSDRGAAVRVLIEAARDLGGADPERTMQYLDEALAMARMLESAADRAGYTAMAAGLSVELGYRGGESGLREAREIAEGIGVTGHDGDMRGVVAENLAEVDSDGALALVATIEAERDRDRHLTNTARRIATTDPDRALAAIDRIRDPWYAAKARAVVAPFFPPEQFERAIEVTRARGGSAEFMSGLAASRLAWVAPEERQAGLIEDAAVGRMEAGDAGGVARVACAARLLGSPRYEEYAVRALSMARMPEDAAELRRAVSGRADLAEGLAFVRPDLGRYLVDATLSQIGGIGRYPAYAVDVLLRAEAALDPDRAAELFLSWPRKEQEGERDYSYRIVAAVKLAQALLDGPSKQEQSVLTEGYAVGFRPIDRDH